MLNTGGRNGGKTHYRGVPLGVTDHERFPRLLCSLRELAREIGHRDPFGFQTLSQIV